MTSQQSQGSKSAFLVQSLPATNGKNLVASLFNIIAQKVLLSVTFLARKKKQRPTQAKGRNGQSLSWFPQHEACPGVLLLSPGWDASPWQGYPPAVCHCYPFIPLGEERPTRDLRSSMKNLLAIPAFNINSYGRRAFSVAAPLLWNNLPDLMT